MANVLSPGPHWKKPGPECLDWSGLGRRQLFGRICFMVVTALAIAFAYLCGCSPILEQPTTSVLPKLEPLQSVLKSIGCTREVIWHGAYGGTSPKPLQLWSTRNLRALVRPKPTNLVSDLITYKKKTVKGKEKNTYSGKKVLLKASQCYCKPFGKAVALLAKSWLAEADSSEWSQVRS